MQHVATGTAWSTRARTFIVAALATLLIFAAAPSGGHSTSYESVIVRALPGKAVSLARSMQSLGARIGRQLKIIGGFQANVPADEMYPVAHDPRVISITPNSSIHMSSFQQSLGYDPDTNFGSLKHLVKQIHGDNPWGSHYFGQGVDVALIDSGVLPVEGLTVPGKIINGPDLSFDSQNPNLMYLDGYGHGTNMAGIIAGRDSTAQENYGDESSFVGVAPEARILSIKVASGDGATDVSQVIAAIDWVVEHRTDNGMNIRVINLSFGTDSTQDYRLDPLDYAVEVAWRSGIVVVAAAGNEGYQTTHLTDPANDPFIISVAAENPNGSDDPNKASVTDFSNSGDGTRNPDIAVPGYQIISLRAPGSTLDTNFPAARIGTRFFRGSGTSQATAAVTGLVALMLSQRPSLTPDQVKYLIDSTAHPFPANTPVRRGNGVPDAGAIKGAKVPTAATSTQTFAYSTGTGSLEAARGGSHVTMNGVDLKGEQDIFGHAWDGNSWSISALAGNTWSGGTWNGNTWSGNSWSGNSWSGNSWSGSTWSGNSWSGNSWSGNSWSSGSWNGNTWSGNTWSGSGWTGNSWSGNTWSSSDYR